MRGQFLLMAGVADGQSLDKRKTRLCVSGMTGVTSDDDSRSILMEPWTRGTYLPNYAVEKQKECLSLGFVTRVTPNVPLLYHPVYARFRSHP